MITSQHYRRDRRTRQHIIDMIGEGTIIREVIWDRGHRNGAEVHKVSDTGIISVYNLNSGKLITRLIARPNQIKRYYPNGDAPIELLAIARHHQNLGYNNKQVERFLISQPIKEGDKTMMKDIKNYTNNNKMFGISQAMDIEQFHNEMLQNDWFCSLGQNHSKTDVIAYGDDYENTVYAVFINGRLDHITLE